MRYILSNGAGLRVFFGLMLAGFVVCSLPTRAQTSEGGPLGSRAAGM